MKKSSILFLALSAMVTFTACEDSDSEDINLDINNTSDLTASLTAGSYEVTETNGDDLADVISWNEVQTDVPVQITYDVQMDVQGGDFSAPELLASTNTNSVALSFEDFNEAAVIGFEADAGVAANYIVRVIARMADPNIDPVVSNAIDVSVIPFSAYPFTDLFLVGAATAPGWNNDNDNPALFRDPAADNTFYYTGFFNADEFKILSTPGMWQPQYGERNGVVGVNDGAGSDPNTFVIPSAGYYDMVIDITGVTNSDDGSSSFTITTNPTAAASPTYNTVGFIGDSTPGGWNADTDMVQSSFDPHKWSARGVTLISGEMKFRANDDWSVNWGSDTELTGQGSMNGPNIPVSPGLYDIFFDDISARYIVIPTE